MVLQKKDFVEIEFIGRVKDSNQVFDSNIPEELKKLNPDAKAKPFVLSLGENMFMPAIEDFLIGKNPGKYSIELTPENAFGNRDSKLVQIVPIKVFYEQKIAPEQGMVFNFDGRLGKILSVSGGRVITDFNHPLAGKFVTYEINVLRKVEDINEQANSLIDFFLRKEVPFKIDGKKLILEIEKKLGEFLKMFENKFKELLDLDLVIKEIGKKLKPEEQKEKSEKNKKEIPEKSQDEVEEIPEKNQDETEEISKEN